MTTITEKLAASLRAILDTAVVCDSPEAVKTARTTLAEYDDLGRPLEVGDRVRVVAPHKFIGEYSDAAFHVGAELTVTEIPGEDAIMYRCKHPDRVFAPPFSRYELERIA